MQVPLFILESLNVKKAWSSETSFKKLVQAKTLKSCSFQQFVKVVWSILYLGIPIGFCTNNGKYLQM